MGNNNDDDMIQIGVEDLPSAEELRQRIRAAAEAGQDVKISFDVDQDGKAAELTVVIEGHTFVGDVTLILGGDALVAVRLAAGGQFEIAGTPASIKATFGVDAKGGVEGGAEVKFSVTESLEAGASYTINSDGEQQAMATLTLRF